MSKIQESFFEDVKEEDIEQEEVKVESKYSLMFAFRPSVGSRERRIFLAHVPFYNIYKKLISICENGMMIGNVSDYVFRFKIDKYECDFGVNDKKSDIDSYITQILDAIGEKKAKSWGHTLLDMEYYIEFHRDSSLTQQEFCQSMTALNRWVVYAMHNFRVLDSSQKIYSEIKLLRDGYTLVKNDTERVGIYGELVADLWKKIYEREYDVSKKESIYLQESDKDAFSELCYIIVNKMYKNNVFNANLEECTTKEYDQPVIMQGYLMSEPYCDVSKFAGYIVNEITNYMKLWFNRIRLADYGQYDEKKYTIFIMMVDDDIKKLTGDQKWKNFSQSYDVVQNNSFCKVRFQIIMIDKNCDSIDDCHYPYKTYIDNRGWR